MASAHWGHILLIKIKSLSAARIQGECITGGDKITESCHKDWLLSSPSRTCLCTYQSVFRQQRTYPLPLHFAFRGTGVAPHLLQQLKKSYCAEVTELYESIPYWWACRLICFSLNAKHHCSQAVWGAVGRDGRVGSLLSMYSQPGGEKGKVNLQLSQGFGNRIQGTL